MGMGTVFVLILLGVIVIPMINTIINGSKPLHEQLTIEHGPLLPKVICPHCQTKGHVRSKSDRVDAGISGAKATGAVITGGASVLVTGLSRKTDVTKCYCGNCEMTWTV